MKRISTLVIASLGVVACASGERRFPMREPMWRDTDLLSVNARCHVEPTPKDAHHVSCAPAFYQSPLYWDGADNLFFRPLSDMLGVVTSGESVNVNSVDEVPDSSWFTNRKIDTDEFRRGACTPEQILDVDHAGDGTWVIDKGKTEGSTPGFRINVPGKGKFLLKASEGDDERGAASSVIGAAVYYAAGYYTSCEQVVYVRPSLLKLTPGLRSKANFQDEKPFDQRALDAIFASSSKRGDRARFSASAWLPGYSIGAFRYEGTRADDPNDVIAHEDRRELRSARLLAAWIDRFDAREGNSFDSWFADAKKPPDSSPGHVIHYQLDTSEALGSVWDWEQISRRLGYSYIFDWGQSATDFVTLGLPIRTWDTVERVKGHEMFGYFNVKDFVPEHWKSEYPNAAFSRMTERDGAWMARILSRITPEMVRSLAKMGDFTDPANAKYLGEVLEGRLRRILERYLTRLSPITDVRVEGGATLCGVDLAERRGVREPERFRYRARWSSGAPLETTHRENNEVCVTLPQRDRGDYARVVIEDGVATGALVVHLQSLGRDGYQLLGLERPNP